MAPSMKLCPECEEEFYAFQLPRHLFSVHGVGDPPRTRGQAKKTSGGGSAESIATGAAEPPPSSSTVPRETIEAPPGGGADETAETAPRKPGLLERMRSRRGRGRGGHTAAPVPGERAPKRPKKYGGRRVSLDTDISGIWGFAGRRLERTPHFATGRMLEYQAPAAGVILDRAIAGTLPDRILFQPLARNRDKYEDVGFLLAGPLLTFTITSTGQQLEALAANQPNWTEDDLAKWHELSARMEMLKEMFSWVLRMMLPRLAEGVKKAQEKEAKDNAAIAEAFPDLGTEDPITVLATSLFEPPIYQEAYANGNGKREPGEPAAPPSPEGAVPFGG